MSYTYVAYFKMLAIIISLIRKSITLYYNELGNTENKNYDDNIIYNSQNMLVINIFSHIHSCVCTHAHTHIHTFGS